MKPDGNSGRPRGRIRAVGCIHKEGSGADDAISYRLDNPVVDCRVVTEVIGIDDHARFAHFFAPTPWFGGSKEVDILSAGPGRAKLRSPELKTTPMKIQMVRWCTLVGLAVASGPSLAQPVEETVEDALTGYTKSNYPTELIYRPWALSKGMIEITALGYMNLSKGEVGKPYLIAPSVYYGIDDLLSVGLTHSLGVCIGGSDYCPNTYNDIAAEALFLLGGPKAHTQFALVGGIDVSSFNPVMAGLHYGANGRVVVGPLALTFKPRFYVGIINRDATIAVAGLLSGLTYGKERVDIPVQLQVQVFSPVALFVQSGFAAPLEGTKLPNTGFTDQYVVPLGVGLSVSVSNRIDIGVTAAFPNFAGKHHTTDARVGSAWVNIRL